MGNADKGKRIENKEAVTDGEIHNPRTDENESRVARERISDGLEARLNVAYLSLYFRTRSAF